jgi:hypothetical protein
MNIAIPTTVKFLFQIAILVASNVSVHWGTQLRAGEGQKTYARSASKRDVAEKAK